LRARQPFFLPFLLLVVDLLAPVASAAPQPAAMVRLGSLTFGIEQRCEDTRQRQGSEEAHKTAPRAGGRESHGEEVEVLSIHRSRIAFCAARPPRRSTARSKVFPVRALSS